MCALWTELTQFLKQTRNLVAVAIVLVGIEELGVLLTAISPTWGTTGPLGVYVSFASFLASLTGFALLRSFETNLRSRTTDPLLAWLYLHLLYWLTAILNGFLLILAIFYILAGGAFQPNWPFTLAVIEITTWYSVFLLLNGLGQDYQSIRGSSWAGAAAFAKLARGMLQEKPHGALTQLSKCLQIARNLFGERQYYPKDLDAISSTLEALAQTTLIQSTALVDVATALEHLPTVKDLPPAFDSFLKEQEWPSGFEHVPRPRRSAHQRLVILLATLTALSTFLTALSDATRQSLFNFVGSFVTSWLIFILAGFGVVIALIALGYAVTYSVPLAWVREYWPRR